MSEKIFDFLNKNPQFISDINPDYKCKLCKNVMVDASYLSCECGYCFKCIYMHLQDNNRTCPICDPYCKNKTIRVNDIQKNSEINIKIEKYLVKCTNHLCDYEDAVDKVVHHLETCDKSKKSCSFVDYNRETLNKNIEENQEKILNIVIKNLNKGLEMKEVNLDNEKIEKEIIIAECDELKKETLESKFNDEESVNENEEFRMGIDNFERINEEIGNVEDQLDSMKSVKTAEMQIEEEMNNLTSFEYIFDEIKEKIRKRGTFWSPVLNSGGDSDMGRVQVQIGISFITMFRWVGVPKESCTNVRFHGRIVSHKCDENESDVAFRKSIIIKVLNQVTNEECMSYSISFSKPNEMATATNSSHSLIMFYLYSAIKHDKICLICDVI